MKPLFRVNPATGKRNTAGEFSEMIRTCCRDRHGMAGDTDFEIRISQKPGDITAWV